MFNKKKKRNPGMVILVVLLFGCIGSALQGFGWLKNRKEQSGEEKILEAFDSYSLEVAGEKFPVSRVVSVKTITDYDTYVEPQYMELCEKENMYRTLALFVEENEDNKKAEIKRMEEIVSRHGDKDTLTVGEQIQKTKLAYMKMLTGENSEQTTELLSEDMNRVAEKKSAMETQSPGVKYVIEAMTDKGTRCRFVFVAKESDPYKLTIAGGGVMQGDMTRAEKESTD